MNNLNTTLFLTLEQVDQLVAILGEVERSYIEVLTEDLAREGFYQVDGGLLYDGGSYILELAEVDPDEAWTSCEIYTK